MKEHIWALKSQAKSSSEKCVMTEHLCGEKEREWQLERSGNNMFHAALCWIFFSFQNVLNITAESGNLRDQKSKKRE